MDNLKEVIMVTFSIISTSSRNNPINLSGWISNPVFEKINLIKVSEIEKMNPKQAEQVAETAMVTTVDLLLEFSQLSYKETDQNTSDFDPTLEKIQNSQEIRIRLETENEKQQTMLKFDQAFDVLAQLRSFFFRMDKLCHRLREPQTT